MSSFINKIDKPHIPIPNYEIGRKSDMISAVLSLDTHEILQCNLMYKIPFNISDDDSNSLIHLVLTNPNKSSELAKLSVIKFLINNGVNPDKPNKYNVTPLHIACHQQLDKIVKYLLENYADPNFKDNMGLTAFHYLLSGNIIPVQSTEPTDFIPIITNVNQERQDALNKLKQDLNDEINNILYGIPLYKTLEKTIKKFLETDKDISKITTNIQLLKISNPSNTSEHIKSLLTLLEDIIRERFPFKPLDNLIIHIPDTLDMRQLSWKPPHLDSTINDLFLIKEGNVERSIRYKIKETYNKISQFLQPTTTESGSDIPQYFDSIKYYVDTYLKPDFFTELGENGCLFYNNDYEKIKKVFTESDNKIRYKFAFDNASSILDFNSLKYTGGPRHLECIFPNHKGIFNFMINNLREMDVDTMLKQFLCSIPEDDEFINRGLPNNKICKEYNDILHTIREGYINLALNIIKLRLNLINKNEYKILINAAKNTPEVSKQFIIKWENIYWYKDGENHISSWLFNMWSDFICRSSSSNLHGMIQFPLLMLISALNYPQIQTIDDLKASIINSYKPHLIAYYINTRGSHELYKKYKIIKIVLVLLKKSNDIINYVNLIFFNNNELENYILALNNNKRYICIKLLQYLDVTVDKYLDDNHRDQFAKYEQLYNNIDKPIQKICKMILDECKNLRIDLLKQTILDFLFLLNKYDSIKDIDITIFNQISILDFPDEIKDLNIDTFFNDLSVILPSYYGYFNVLSDNQESDKIHELSRDHFKIAHILGLYYEGIFHNIENIIIKYYDKFCIGRGDDSGNMIKIPSRSSSSKYLSLMNNYNQIGGGPIEQLYKNYFDILFILYENYGFLNDSDRDKNIKKIILTIQEINITTVKEDERHNVQTLSEILKHDTINDLDKNKLQDIYNKMCLDDVITNSDKKFCSDQITQLEINKTPLHKQGNAWANELVKIIQGKLENIINSKPGNTPVKPPAKAAPPLSAKDGRPDSPVAKLPPSLDDDTIQNYLFYSIIYILYSYCIYVKNVNLYELLEFRSQFDAYEQFTNIDENIINKIKQEHNIIVTIFNYYTTIKFPKYDDMKHFVTDFIYNKTYERLNLQQIQSNDIKKFVGLITNKWKEEEQDNLKYIKSYLFWNIYLIICNDAQDKDPKAIYKIEGMVKQYPIRDALTSLQIIKQLNNVKYNEIILLVEDLINFRNMEFLIQLPTEQEKLQKNTYDMIQLKALLKIKLRDQHILASIFTEQQINTINRYMKNQKESEKAPSPHKEQPPLNASEVQEASESGAVQALVKVDPSPKEPTLTPPPLAKAELIDPFILYKIYEFLYTEIKYNNNNTDAYKQYLEWCRARTTNTAHEKHN